MPRASDLIRNLRFPDHVKGSQVKPKAFKPSANDQGSGLSVYQCKNVIRTQEDLDAYQQEVCKHPDGLLGLCLLDMPNVEAIGLTVVADPVDFNSFGQLHHAIQNVSEPNLCPNESEQKALALQATEYGQVRPMIPKPN